MNQERFVQVPSKVLESLLSMASAHVEDINSGIEEGIYCASENKDVEVKQADIAAAEALMLKSLAGGERNQLQKIDEAVEGLLSILDHSGALDAESTQKAAYELRLQTVLALGDAGRIEAAKASLADLNIA